MAKTNEGLITINSDVITRIHQSLTNGSLDDLVKRHKRAKSVLLVDASGSMSDPITAGGSKMEAAREVVKILREANPVPVAAFGLSGDQDVAFVDVVPAPSGMTPLHKGIEFCQAAKATHIVVVTDGVPDSQSKALAAARAFDGVIDVFYIGDGTDEGAEFCRRLAQASGGTANVTDLSDPRYLASKIAGYLDAAAGL